MIISGLIADVDSIIKLLWNKNKMTVQSW